MKLCVCSPADALLDIKRATEVMVACTIVGHHLLGFCPGSTVASEDVSCSAI